MNGFYYAAAGVFSITVTLLVNSAVLFRKDERPEVEAFRRFLWSVMLFFLADAGWGYLWGTGRYDLLYNDTLVYYVTMAVSVAMGCRYITVFLKLRGWWSKLVILAGMVFCFMEVILLLINHYFPIIFWIDAKGVFTEGMLRNTTYVVLEVLFGTISLLSFLAVPRGKSRLRSRHLAVAWFGVIITLSLVAQMLWPLLPFYSLGIMLGTLVLLVFVREEDLRYGLEQKQEMNQSLLQVNQALAMQKQEMEHQLNVIGSLSHGYEHICYFDLTTGFYKTIKKEGRLSLMGDDGDEGGLLEYMDEKMKRVDPEFKDKVAAFYNPDTVADRLAYMDHLELEYCVGGGQWTLGEIKSAGRDEMGRCTRVLWSVRSIEEQRRQVQEHQRELEAARDAANAANEAKSSFLLNMSRNLRTPMNTIVGFTRMLKNNQDGPDKQAGYLDKIEGASTLMMSILDSVLEISHIEKGLAKVDEKAWKTEQMMESIGDLFVEPMRIKGVEFFYSMSVQHHYAYMDPAKMRELWINLLSNAYKFTPSGGKVTLWTEELPSEREGYLLYRTILSDTGIGMSAEFLPHVFDEFSREDASTDAKLQGSGLGMSIAKKLVNLMNGSIMVQSTKGEGTTVVVTLPLRIADEKVMADHEGVRIDPSMFAGKRVLMAEDNDLNAEIATEILQEAGFVVDRACDGAEAVRMVAQSDDDYYSIVLMDIQMPNMDGYEATQALRALPDVGKARIPILAMTACAFEEDKRKALSVGMNGHLAKPINIAELMKGLANMIG